MSTTPDHVGVETRDPADPVPNGAAMAAVLASGIGSFALGIFVLLHASGLFSAPAVYAAAGGVSGRTTFALMVWLVSWGILHRRWKDHVIPPGRTLTATLVLVAASLLATFPPLWAVF